MQSVSFKHLAMPAPMQQDNDSYEESDGTDDGSESTKSSNKTVVPPPPPPALPAQQTPAVAAVGRGPGAAQRHHSPSRRHSHQVRRSHGRSRRSKSARARGQQRNKRDRSRGRRQKRRSHRHRRGDRRRKESQERRQNDNRKRRSEEKRRSRSRTPLQRDKSRAQSAAPGIKLQERKHTNLSPTFGKLNFQCQHCGRRFGTEHSLEQHQWSSQYCAEKQGKGRKARKQCTCGSWITDEARAWQQHYNASPACDPNAARKEKQTEAQQQLPQPQQQLPQQQLAQPLPSSGSSVANRGALSSLFLSLSQLTNDQ